MGFAFGDASGEVVAGTGVPAQSAQGDAVEGRIGLSVAAAVEATAAGLARGGFHGVDTAQSGEGCLAAQPVGVVGSGNEQSGGIVGPMPQRVSNWEWLPKSRQRTLLPLCAAERWA